MPRRARAPATPDAIERAYTLAVRSINARLVKAARAFLARPLARARTANAPDTRLDADDLSAFADLDFGALRIRLGRIAASGASRIVNSFGQRIGTWNREDMERILTIDLADETSEVRAVLDAWRRENVALIQSIAVRLHDDVHQVVRDAQRNGTHVRTLSRQIQERFDVSRSRATLIARDQITKANGDLAQVRQTSAGITRYAWSTSRDEKVRPDHAALEGTIHSWDQPPVTNRRTGDRNHPGGDISCRCTAIPLLN